MHYERDPPGIRRPGEVIDAPLFLRQLLCFTAGAGENPELVVLVFVPAVGKEGDPFTVRAPARMRLLVVAKSKGPIFRAVPFREPEIARLFVFRQINCPDHVGHAFAVGRKSRLIDITDGSEILRFQQAFLFSRESAGNRERKQENDEATTHKGGALHDCRRPREQN